MISSLVRMVAASELSSGHMRFITTLRLWAMMGRMGWCPVPVLIEQLGNRRAAAQFQLLMEEVGAVWPEPFCVSPPCSPNLSHDEATLAQMLGFAAEGNMPGFDQLLADLLCTDVRERLFASAAALIRNRRPW